MDFAISHGPLALTCCGQAAAHGKERAQQHAGRGAGPVQQACGGGRGQPAGASDATATAAAAAVARWSADWRRARCRFSVPSQWWPRRPHGGNADARATSHGAEAATQLRATTHLGRLCASGAVASLSLAPGQRGTTRGPSHGPGKCRRADRRNVRIATCRASTETRSLRARAPKRAPAHHAPSMTYADAWNVCLWRPPLQEHV